MAKRSRSGASEVSLGEVAVMAVAGWPLSIIPPMMALAMLPAPMKVTLLAIAICPSVLCCSLWMLPGAKNCCSQPHQGSAFKHGGFQVVTHPHRQGIQRCFRKTEAQRFQCLAQAGQRYPLGFQRGGWCRNRH